MYSVIIVGLCFMLINLNHLDYLLQAQLKLPRNQVLALFNKAMRKLHGQLHKASAKKIESALPRLKEVVKLSLPLYTCLSS